MNKEALGTTLLFIESINRHDEEMLHNLLAQEHELVDPTGNLETDIESIENAWKTYLESYPDYHLYIRRIFQNGDIIYLVGHTTGSHLNLPDAEEFHSEGVIWISQVKDGKVARWQLQNDSPEAIKRLDLDKHKEIFHPELFAKTIAKHLDLLHEDARTRDVRNVRKYYSRLYRHAPPEKLLAISEKLLFDEGYRFVPYELIYYHPGAISLLNPEKVTALGVGINNWSSTDIFAHYIAGPAWKQGVISDHLVDEWIHSDNIWWRRAALVSTIYLYGDVDRMLKYSEILIDDDEDLIIKAISWVLREATKYDPQAVIDFLSKHNDQLAARIKREVTNKLKTGLKNP